MNVENKILAMTIFAEAWDEPIEGQRAVAWVIKNRADQGTKYGGPTIKGVCLEKDQLDCWNYGPKAINSLINSNVQTQAAYKAIEKWIPNVFWESSDSTSKSDYFNNPSIEGYLDGPNFRYRVKRTVKIGNLQFYKSY